jgi:hypothetical protein
MRLEGVHLSQFARRMQYGLLLLPPIIVLAVYWPILNYGKVWDDWLLLGEFGHYKDPTLWWRVLANPLPFSGNYFRPLVVFSFILEGYYGLADFFSHLLNILIHGANSVLLILLAERMWPKGQDARLNRIVATGVGIVYALHPAMTEGTIWIAGRFDLLVTSFILLALLADSSVRSAPKRALIVGLCFFAALLCKEMAITLPILLVLLHAARSTHTGFAYLFTRERLQVYAALLLALAAYAGVRHASLGYLMTSEPEMAFLQLGTTLQRILLIGAAFSGYLSTMLMPLSGITPLHYTSLPIPVTDMSAWLGLFLLVLFIGFGFLLARRQAWHLPILCLGAAVVSLLPVLHISAVPMLLGNTLTADRSTMVPILFLTLALGGALVMHANRKGFAAAGLVAAVWICFSVFIIRAIVPLWSNDMVLWHWLSTDNPACSVCHINYARQLVYGLSPEMGLKEADLGLAQAQQPWQVAMAHDVRSKALAKLGRKDEAIDAATAAFDAEPVQKQKALYLAQRISFLTKAGRYGEATADLRKALEMNSQNDRAYLGLLGDLALATDRPDIARNLYRQAFEFAPQNMRSAKLAKTDDPVQWKRLGDQFAAQHATADAEAAYKEARRLGNAN